MTEKSSEQIKEPLIEKKDLNPELETKLVSVFSLFRYADTKDKIYLFVGTISALITGCSFPFFMIFFGDILPVFYEKNRFQSAELALQVGIKFFIIGGATWFFGKKYLICSFYWTLLLESVWIQSVAEV